MKKADCIGCHDDFYNQPGNGYKGQCWMFEPGKALEVRFYIHRDSPMGQRSNYKKETRPPCYHRQIGVYVDKIPDYAQ